jgi:diamine N-acetyltransferase
MPERRDGQTTLAVDLCFGDLGANRLWLDVFDDNERARRAYRAVGFREEGILREAARRQDGSLGSLVVMAMLARERPES